MSKFGIRPKILLLISMILISEIGFCAILYQMIESSQRLVEKEKHARQVREVATLIGRTLGAGHSEIEVYLATKNQTVLENLKSRMTNVEANIRKLETLTKEDLEWRQAVVDLADVSRRIISMQEDFFNHPSDDIHSIQFLAQIQKQVVIARENERIQNRLDAIMQNCLKDLEEKEREAREKTLLTLLLGLFCNIGVAVFAGLTLSKNIAERMEYLAENASRFAIELPLHLKRGGADEIGRLETAFHDMAQTVSVAREKEQAIIKSMHIGLITVDAKFKIESLNPKAQALYGYTEDQLIGHRLSKLFVNNDDDQFIHSLETVGEVLDLEAKGKRRTFAVECFVTTLPVQPPKYLVSVLDITERQEAERLRQDLISMLSHDLRAPLTNIRATVDLMHHQEEAGAEKRSEFLDNLSGTRNEIDRMMRLIGDLLDIARMESGKFPLDRKMIQIWAPISRSVKAVNAQAEQKKVSIEVEETELEVLADAARLEQVFVNLLTNALKATNDGGPIKIGFNTEPDFITISVADSGCGISNKDTPHVFDKFYRPSNSDTLEGYGLGLTICKTIIEQHGGKIRFESEQGKGTTFFITLPGSNADPPLPSTDA